MHRLIVPQLSLAVLLCWLVGLPVFTAGLVRGTPDLIAAGAVAMLIGTAANAVHLWMLTRRAESAPAADAALSSVSPRQEGRARP